MITVTYQGVAQCHMPRGTSSIAWFHSVFGFDEGSYSATRAKFVVSDGGHPLEANPTLALILTLYLGPLSYYPLHAIPHYEHLRYQPPPHTACRYTYTHRRSLLTTQC